MKRRKLLQNLGLGVASLPLFSFSKNLTDKPDTWKEEFTPDRFNDEKFWKRFSKTHYNVADDFVNLENGYFGVQPISVQKAYIENIKNVNQYSSRYMRTDYNSDYQNIVRQLAEFSAVDENEILITRNATEAMNILIQGLGLKKRGRSDSSPAGLLQYDRNLRDVGEANRYKNQLYQNSVDS